MIKLQMSTKLSLSNAVSVTVTIFEYVPDCITIIDFIISYKKTQYSVTIIY